MKKTSDFKSKILLSTSASILLGLILSNPRLAKADSLSADQDNQSDSPATHVVNTPKDVNQNNQASSTETPVTRTANPDKAEENDTVNTTDSQIGSTGTSNTASRTSSTTRAVSSQSSVITGIITDCEGLRVSWNYDTQELTIFGGTYHTSDEGGLYKRYIFTDDGQYRDEFRDVKKIKIVGKVDSDGDFSEMFSGFSELIEIEGIDNLDTSNVTDIKMNSMFTNCLKLTKIEGLNKLDTSNVIDMSHMFAFCPELASLDLSSFNTSQVTNMTGMFVNCSSLINLDLSSFDTSQVTDMSCMFMGCEGITQLDLSNFDTSNAISLRYMFAEATSLVDVNVSSFTFNLKETIEMEAMFEGCSSIVNLDLSSFKTHRSAEATGMFRDCTSLKTLNIKNLDLGCLFLEGMLEGANNLEVLVLGPRTPLADVHQIEQEDFDPDNGYMPGSVGLNVPGIWVNVGKGTIDNPEASTRWTSLELMKNRAWFEEDVRAGLDDSLDGYDLNPDLIAETYVRVGQPVTIHYQDENGKTIKKDDVRFGRIGENFSFSAAKIHGYELKADSQSTFTGQYDAANEQPVIFVYTPLKSPNTSDGSNGSDSSNGSNGSNTSDSSDSSNGSNGSNTSDGSNGSDSSNGSNGSNTSDGSNGSNDSNGSTGSIPDVPELAAPDKSNYQHHKTRQPKITETSYHKTNKLEHDMPKSKAADPELPKTGKNSVSQLLTTALGLVSATSASALAWIKRKKN